LRCSSWNAAIAADDQERTQAMNFADETMLTPMQAEAIARGLYAVAASDGVHEREAALVASFLGDVGVGPTALAQLARSPRMGGQELSQALGNDEVRKIFFKTALLLAWADGKVSPQERAVLDEYSKALSIAGSDAEHMETSVKEYLLSHLSHVANTQATTEVAKKLQI
jgi:tellurite resistance protein